MRTRQEAATLEAELKELIDRNSREIRKMIVDFRNILRDVDTEWLSRPSLRGERK